MGTLYTDKKDTHIIVWVNEHNEHQGMGLAPMPKDVAKRVCQQFNEKYPNIKHEAVPVRATDGPAAELFSE